MPPFVRTPEATAEIAVLGRELDRSKGAGNEHGPSARPHSNVDLVAGLFEPRDVDGPHRCYGPDGQRWERLIWTRSSLCSLPPPPQSVAVMVAPKRSMTWSEVDPVVRTALSGFLV